MAAMIDGNLSEEERAAHVRHLAECEECREAVAEYARAVDHVGLTSRRDETADTSPDALRRTGRSRFWFPLAATVGLATVAGLLVLRNQPQPVTDAPAPAPTQPASSDPAPPAPAVPSPPPQPAPPAPAPADDVSVRRSGTRSIGGKTFRLIAGEWVDTAYDPLALLPEAHVTPANRDATFAKVPRLAPFAALGPRFVIVLDGTVYKFATP
jgi:hypothetical protein